MKINVERGAFLKALSHVQSVVERRNTIPILSNVMIEAGKGQLKLTATDLDIEIVEAIPADVIRNGAATAPAHMLYDIVRKLPDGAQVQAELLASEGGRLAVSAGSVRFELACLPKEDFPQMAAGALPHKFRLAADDLKRLIDKTRFAISTEETRFYLNGIYVHAAKDGKTRTLRAVATDGHRLARYELDLPDGAADMPGVIVPRKTVTELRRLLDDADGAIEISLSDTKIQFQFGSVELTSKLIDGTFPEYQRVIPSGNDKALSLEFEGVFAERRSRLDHLGRQDARGEACHRQGQGNAFGGQSGIRHRDRGGRRDLQREPDRDRLQREISSRHYRPDRRQGSALPALRRRIADHHRRRGGQPNALRPHADAGMML